MTTLKRQPKTVKSFCVSFFKKRPLIGARVALVALRRERNNLIVRKRHGRVNFDEVKRGDTLRSEEGRLRQWRSLERTSGGSPFSIIKLTQCLRTVGDACPFYKQLNQTPRRKIALKTQKRASIWKPFFMLHSAN